MIEQEQEQQRHRRAFAIFDELIDLPEADRAARLETLCVGDASLRAALEAMLAADDEAGEPLLQIAARASDSLRAEASQDESILGRQIGVWRITAMLGHGGMGAVYEVQRADATYSQRAALKLIRAASDSPSARSRFLRERQTLARLQHPNIATLLDGGISSEGAPYFVMEYIDGQSIVRWCDERTLGLRQRVELFAQVLEAVGYAHRNLVVHRDLKPSNLMVDRDGHVKLLDFGIAKELKGGDLTQTGDRALTFEYASPEQLQQAPITTATDIWQLGVVLHCLLSGAHPFGITEETPLPKQLQQLERSPEPLTKAAAHAGVEQAASRGASSPQALSASMRGGLTAIVANCLQREPEARYASVDALAADLRRWLDGRPVAAAPISRRERAWLWLRRNRLLATSTAAVAAALLVGTGVSLWQAQEARLQARRAEQQSANARAAMQFLVDTLAAAAPEQALNTEVKVRTLLDKARAHLKEDGAMDPAVRQAVLRQLGRLYFSLGESRIASELFAEGLRGLEPQQREEALSLADDLSAQTNVLIDMEERSQALATAQRAAALRVRFAPEDVAQQLRSHRDLGTGYYGNQELDKAEKQWQTAIALTKTMATPPVAEVISVHEVLGSVQSELSQRAKALQTFEDGLAFADRFGVPAASPLRISLMRRKGEVLIASGQAPAAEQIIHAAIELQSKAVGVGGVEAGALYNALGLAQFEQGHFGAAAATFARSNAVFSSAAYAPSQQVAALANEAAVNESAGDYARARLLYDRAVAQLDAAHVGATDAVRRGVLRNASRVLTMTGDFGAARELLERLQAQARQIDGPDSQEYAWVLWQRVVLARRMQDEAGGTRLLEESRSRWSKLVPQTHPIFAHAQINEAVFAELRGDLATAERLLREAETRLEAAAKPVDVAVTRATLARIRFKRGDPVGARTLLSLALPVLRESVLPTHVGRSEAEQLARRLL
ncbi:protein kinase domain-containing protein [Roseateles sp. P5_E7]